MASETKESSGVQQLIDRLHKDGVTKGRAEAEELIAAARQHAAEILDKAKQEADEIVSAARQEAERTRAGGEEAVRLAGRDAILSSTEKLREDFVRRLRHLVGHTLHDRAFLKRLILEITRDAVPSESDRRMNVMLLNEGTLGSESTQPIDEETLNEFVLSIGAEVLRDGVTFEIADSDVPGVRVQLVDDDLEVDLTTKTLTHLLLEQLSPQFRAMIE